MTSGAKRPPGQAELAFDGPVLVNPAPATHLGSHGLAASLSAWAPANWPVAADWRTLVDHFFSSSVGRQLGHFVDQRLTQGAVVYPPTPLRALEITSLAAVRVVILGQDPYHGPNQAEGLAFSVSPGVRPPPSLRNVFKEIARDPVLLRMRSASSVASAAPGAPFRARAADALAMAQGSGSLSRWAQQGVLLINTCFTVEQGQPGSHARRGWEVLTDAIVRAVAARPGPVVFLLWGAHAQAKQALIASAGACHQTGHLVLTANHPSPLSAQRPPKPFIGCGHFSQANEFLLQKGQMPVEWEHSISASLPST